MCIELDKKIDHYRRLASSVVDSRTVHGISRAVEAYTVGVGGRLIPRERVGAAEMMVPEQRDGQIASV